MFYRVNARCAVQRAPADASDEATVARVSLDFGNWQVIAWHGGLLAMDGAINQADAARYWLGILQIRHKVQTPSKSGQDAASVLQLANVSQTPRSRQG